MNYQQMYQKFVNGQITQAQWVAFATDYLYNVVMADQAVVDVMVRLKNRG